MASLYKSSSLNTFNIHDGYATIIHKFQGVIIDQAFVLASPAIDRHLTYVAMTRHKEDVKLYSDQKALTAIMRCSAKSKEDLKRQYSQTNHQYRFY